MDISFYTAAVGAQQQQMRLDVHANNIANVNNYGFRARRPDFQTLMTGAVRGINETVQRGVGSRLEADQADFSPAGFVGTERLLDYGIEGRGFFALMNPTTGEYTYTREGSFTLSNTVETIEPEVPEDAEPGTEAPEPETVFTWYLSDGSGRYVVGTDGRPITIANPSEDIALGQLLPIGIFDFINHDGMLSEGLSGVIPLDKNGQVAPGEGKLIQGYLELSNVDYAYELAKVIESQRSFQYMLRMAQTSDEITTTVNGLR
ncbi:MAG: flagellar hook-basal body complex protein [Oscillibacter sp.]|nr:flagellar hook-basal body complex protein [Oscillibacter sp.]